MLSQSNKNYRRYSLRKKFVHKCTLPAVEKIKIEEYYPKSNILTKRFLLSSIITTDIYRRKIYAKSNKVLEKERRIQLQNYKYRIHPFSDFAYFWELLMIIILFVQLTLTPIFIFLRTTIYSKTIYFILTTQILTCLNILVSCFTGYYRTDIKEVVLDQKLIILNSIKSGNLVVDLLGSFPIPFLCYVCGTTILTERLVSCFISFNICSLVRYVESIQQKRGLPFMIFKVINAFLVLTFGIAWLTVLIYIGARLDRKDKLIDEHYNAKIWWWVYNTFAFMKGIEIHDFCFIGYEFFFSTIAIIFGILIRNIIVVEIVIICKTWYLSERKRARLFKELDEFCYYKRLPNNLKERLFQYYAFKLPNVYYNESEINNQLSENLRYHIKEYTYKELFQADIFKLCPLALRQLITIHLEEEIYFKNDVIYEAGDPYEYIYYIKSGSILQISEETKEIVDISEGNFFSERALLPGDNSFHQTTVIALESSQMFKLSRTIFLKIIQNYQSSYVTILDILEKRDKYLFNANKLSFRLKLGDYYKERRNTDIEEN